MQNEDSWEVVECIYGRHMGIWHDEPAAAARPLNPLHTCHSASRLSQPQGTPARGRSLQALWVNERSVRLSNQQPLEERPLALMHGSFWGRRSNAPTTLLRSGAPLGSFKHAPSWVRTPTGNRSAFCHQALGSSWLT